MGCYQSSEGRLLGARSAKVAAEEGHVFVCSPEGERACGVHSHATDGGLALQAVSSAAGEEFKMRLAAKKKEEEEVTHGDDHNAYFNCGGGSPVAVGDWAPLNGLGPTVCLKNSFNTSHRQLLGCCWDSCATEPPFLSPIHKATPNKSASVANHSFGHVLAPCEAKSSTTNFSFSDMTGVLSFASVEARNGRLGGLSAAHNERHVSPGCSSHWVSLVWPRPSGLKRRGAGAGEENTCAASRVSPHARTNGGSCTNTGAGTYDSRRQSTGMPLNDLSGGPVNIADHLTTGFSAFGAKNIWAFSLSDELSREKDAAFLRKHGLCPHRGVNVHRWDRADFFSPNTCSLSIALAREQSPPPPSVSSSFSFATAVSSSSHSLGCVCVRDTPQFPLESTRCHLLAASTSRFPGLFATGAAESSLSPSTSLAASTQDVVNGAGGPSGCKDISSQMTEAAATLVPMEGEGKKFKILNSTHGGAACAPKRLMDYRCGHGGSAGSNDDSNRNGRNPVFRTTGRHEESSNPQGNTLNHGAHRCSISSEHQGHERVLTNIVVSSFDVSMDLFEWKKNGFYRTPVDVNRKKLSARQKFGQGVVTRVMYGGVFVVECSSKRAEQELEKELRLLKPSKKRKHKTLLAEMSKALRDSGITNEFVTRTTTTAIVEKEKENSGFYERGCHERVRHSRRMSFDVSTSACELYQVLCCVGGGSFAQKREPLTKKKEPSDVTQTGVTNGRTGHCVTTPWVELKTLMSVVRPWLLQLVFYPQCAEPISVYVQKFVGILPLMRLVVCRDSSSHHVVATCEGENGNENDDSLFVNDVSKDDGVSEADVCERSISPKMESPSNSELCSTLGRNIPVPIVLHTGRAMTAVSGDADRALSSASRGSSDRSFETSGRSSEATRRLTPTHHASQGHMRTEATARETEKRKRRGARKGTGSGAGATHPFTPDFLKLSSKMNCVHLPRLDQQEQSSPPSPSPSPRKPQQLETENGSRFNGTAKNPQETELVHGECSLLSNIMSDNEILWERDMLEVKALESELLDVLNALSEAEEHLCHLDGIVHDLQLAFLPNSGRNTVESICTYLLAAIEEPFDLPGLCGCFDGSDWFSCLAAVLTHPQNSLQSVKISRQLTMSSFPHLGMLAGLLFHEHATRSLRHLSIECGDLCEDLSLDTVFKCSAERERQGRRYGEHEDDGDYDYCFQSTDLHNVGGKFRQISFLWSDEHQHGMPFFLTPSQAERVLLTLTSAVMENARQRRLTFQLKDFPTKPANRLSLRFSRSLKALWHRTRRSRSDGESVPSRLPQTGRGAHARREATCRPFRAAGGLRDAARRAWQDAEHRPFCVLLRRRDVRPRYFAAPRGHDGDDRADDGEPLCEQTRWVYGLQSAHVTCAVLLYAKERLLKKAPVMFDALRSFVKKYRGREDGGDVPGRGEVVLTR